MMQKTWKMIETLANEYSSESSQWELSNEYQHDRVSMVFKNLCVLVLWTNVASALEGLINLSIARCTLNSFIPLVAPKNALKLSWCLFQQRIFQKIYNWEILIKTQHKTNSPLLFCESMTNFSYLWDYYIVIRPVWTLISRRPPCINVHIYKNCHQYETSHVNRWELEMGIFICKITNTIVSRCVHTCLLPYRMISKKSAPWINP